MEAPLLALLGGADQKIRAEHFEELYDRLAARGLASQLHVYDGAPHSFFDRSFADHAAACADAWVRVLDFIDQRTAA